MEGERGIMDIFRLDSYGGGEMIRPLPNPSITHVKGEKDFTVDSKKIIVPVIFIGAVWMLFIVTIPMIFNGQFNASVSFGGTSIVIVVGVIVETMSQIRSMQTTYQTRGFLK